MYNVVSYLEDYNQWGIEDIDPNKLTHINLCFAGIQNNKINVEILHKVDLVKSFKMINPDLKLMVCIGGIEAKEFSNAALDKDSRDIFIKSILDFLDLEDFDGVDLDWEYPCSSACGFIARPEDKQNFTFLLKELRENLDELGQKNNKHYILSIAAGAGQDYIDNTEMNLIHNYLDFINIMTYDFHNSFEKLTGHHTNLYDSLSDNDRFSAHRAVNLLVKSGVPKNKLHIGAAFYGRGWTNVINENNGLYEPASCDKELAYCYHDLLNNYINKNNKDGYIRYWDNDAKAPYLFNGSTFITYDDEESVRCKADYVKHNGLAGIMFWEYTEDHTERLLNTIYDNLHGDIL